MPDVDLEYLKLEVYGKQLLGLSLQRYNKDNTRPREADDTGGSGHSR